MKKQFTILLILIFVFGLFLINFIKDVRASNIPAPIAYYDFNDETSINTGAINDKMGNYNGQNYNGVWTSDGYSGGAMIFDCAKNDYGMKTLPLPDLNNYTLLYRVKVNAGSGRSITYVTSGDFSLSITYGSPVESFNNNFNINSSGIPNLDYKFNSDGWEHLIIVYNGSENILYRNGAEVGRASLMKGLPNPLLASSQWIFGGVPGGCPIGTNLQLDEIKIYNVALTIDQILEEYNKDVWECGNWETCSVGGEQIRVCTKTYDCPTDDTLSPSTIQSCTYIPPVPSCTSNNWSCADWSSCSLLGRQIRTCTQISNCRGGISEPATSQSCTYVPTCTSYSWSCGSWSSCSSNSTQTRICSKISNCEGGVSPPSTSQSCTYTPSCNADTWTCSAWNTCSLSGIQNRSCTKTFDCPNMQTASPITDQYCEAPSRPQQAPPSESDEISNQDTIIKSTVKLLCPVDNYKASQGSGTVIDSTGTILTNKHVIAGTVGCLVGFIDGFNDEPYFGNRQIADITKISSTQDIAILKMRNPGNKKVSFVDTTKSTINFSLGTKITTYGYPAKFGTKITYTSGDFSGTDGNYLKTTAILEYGNSGGGAYLKNGTFIGIPSAVVKGELNALGYILSINTIKAWLGNSSIASGNTNNNYSRVSVLEDIDLNKLDSLKLFIPDVDDKGNLSASATNKNSQNTKEQPQLNQPQKKSVIPEQSSSAPSERGKENKQEKGNNSGIKVSEQRRSIVANAVQEIVKVAERNGGIGQEIKIVAQTQTQNQEKLEEGIQKIQSRSGFAKFFIGPNYSEIKNSQKLLEQNREQIQKMNEARTQIVNQGDQLQVIEQIQALEQVDQQIETLLNEAQKGFSLFGWLFRLFSR